MKTRLRLALVFMLAASLPPSAHADAADLRGAISQKNSSKVEQLLASGALVNEADSEGVTPLMLAAQQESPALLLRLLTAGADPHLARPNGLTALHYAAAYGRPDAVRALLDKGADINAAPASGTTPLLNALSSSEWATANLLLDRGASLSATPSGKLALSRALRIDEDAGFGDLAPLMDAALARRLIAAGASVDLEMEGTTPLHMAVRAHQPEVIRVLLGQGVKVDALNQEGATPLLLATKSANLELMLTGLTFSASISGQAGVDPRAAARRLRTAGFGNDPPRTRAALADIDMRRSAAIDALLAGGANPNTRDSKGDTPLVSAAAISDPEVTQSLLKAGADPNLIVSGRYSALMRAAKEGHAEVVAALLAGGAQVDLRNDIGETALMRAAYGGGALQSTRVLISAGADINARNAAGETPLMYALGVHDDATLDRSAISEELTQVVSALIAAGADPRLADNKGNTPTSLAQNPKYRPAARLIQSALRELR